MFENLRRAFAEAVDNFNRELNRDAVPEHVDKLLVGMRSELVDAKAHIKKLTSDLAAARASFEKETHEVKTCLRREQMALEIGDAETAELARQYAEKHERRRMVLEQKVQALEDELGVAEADYASMTEQYKKAEASRASLTAQAGRAQARDSIQGAGDLFDRMDQIEEQIEDQDHQAQAAREMDREFDLGGSDDFRVPPARDIDDRLADLKRRMGEDD